MKHNNLFIMDKREAIDFIWECINSWLETYGDSTGRIEDCVNSIVRNYNEGNVFGNEIDCYEYFPWSDDFNGGNEIGMCIEDDHFIFPEFADDWEKFQEEHI